MPFSNRQLQQIQRFKDDFFSAWLHSIFPFLFFCMFSFCRKYATATISLPRCSGCIVLDKCRKKFSLKFSIFQEIFSKKSRGTHLGWPQKSCGAPRFVPKKTAGRPGKLLGIFLRCPKKSPARKRAGKEGIQAVRQAFSRTGCTFASPAWEYILGNGKHPCLGFLATCVVMEDAIWCAKLARSVCALVS